MARANAVAFPLLMNQPIAGRIAKVWADNSERFTGHELRFAKQACSLRRR